MKAVVATLLLAAVASAADLDTLLTLAQKGNCAVPCLSGAVNALGCKEGQGPIDLICANLEPIVSGSAECLTKCELDQRTQGKLHDCRQRGVSHGISSGADIYSQTT